MNEHHTTEASPDAFDGDAISRADRDFLARLGDHPLVRHPLYGVPCPPTPDFNNLRPEEDKEALERAVFATVIDWMLVNYAYREGAFVSRGGAISLVDGEIVSLMDLRGRMAPWALMEIGPRGGVKMHSPAEDWLRSTARLSIRREEMRPDRPRPTFTEDGYHIFNRYRPQVHPIEGGDLAPFEAFFARLFPDATERTWCWNYLAHKTRRPWVPMIGVIMVAEEFGTGRGTLFEILALLFGREYVVPCTFGELTGTSAAARFNARLADALFVVVNEAVAEDGHQQTQRRLHYDALKNVVDPSPTQRRRFEAKQQHAYAQTSAASTIIATNHRDVVKLPRDDRRFEVLTCGRKMTPAETTELRTWMADLKNIGALHRALLAASAVPLDVFNPYGVPPPFAGRLEMIGMAQSRIEDAYEAAMDALEGSPLFTMTQAKRLIGYFGDYASGDWSNQALHTVAKNAYRLRKQRIRHRKRKEIVYARTEAERRRWFPADKAMIVAALDRAEERVVRVINTGQDDILAQLKEAGRKPPEKDEEREDED
jgi:Family of unknown function (DUF5906)